MSQATVSNTANKEWLKYQCPTCGAFRGDLCFRSDKRNRNTRPCVARARLVNSAPINKRRTMTLDCPGCGHGIEFEDELPLGEECKCPKCGVSSRVEHDYSGEYDLSMWLEIIQ